MVENKILINLFSKHILVCKTTAGSSYFLDIVRERQVFDFKKMTLNCKNLGIYFLFLHFLLLDMRSQNFLNINCMKFTCFSRRDRFALFLTSFLWTIIINALFFFDLTLLVTLVLSVDPFFDPNDLPSLPALILSTLAA